MEYDKQFLAALLCRICEKIVKDFKPKNPDGTPVTPLDIVKHVSEMVFVLENQLLEHEIVVKNYLEASVADNLYAELYKLPWGPGIKTRFGGETRKAIMVSTTSPLFDFIMQYVEKAIREYKIGHVVGFYLNLYENGDMWTPNHVHRGTNQLVLSLGGTRSLKVGDRKYTLENGDCIMFGEHLHGIPKTKKKCAPRISIATFCDL